MEDILKKHVFCPYSESQWDPVLIYTHLPFLHGQKQFRHSVSMMKLHNNDRIFIFWVNYTFKTLFDWKNIPVPYSIANRMEEIQAVSL